MFQEDVERGQEFRKCIECFLCQDVCHVIRDHEENKPAFAGPRFFMRLAELRCTRWTPTTARSWPGSRRAWVSQHHEVLPRGLTRAYPHPGQGHPPA